MDALLKAHEFAIYQTKFVNGSYDRGSLQLVYSTPNYAPQNNQGNNGPRGPTGSVGAIGPTGPRGTYEDIPRYEVKYKKHNAYIVKCRPREDNKESYESLILPFVDEYNDLGLQMVINQPSYDRVRKGILPAYQNEFEVRNQMNAEIETLNECIQYLFDSFKNNVDINIEEYVATTNLSQGSRTFLTTTYDRLVRDLTQFREGNHLDDSDDDSDDSDDDYRYEPDVYNYKYRVREPDYHWFEYGNLVRYNTEPKLELYVHEGTRLYTCIRELIPGDGSYTKSAR